MSTSRTARSLGMALIALLALLALAQSPGRAQSPDPAQLELGARLYAENCAVCHGPNGEGRVGATLAKDWPSIRPDLDVKNIISNGIPGSVMPAWSQTKGGPFSTEEIDALTTFVLSWSEGGIAAITPFPTPTARPEVSPVPNVSGDPNHGAVLFDQNCKVCHGPNGEGRIGATLAQNWPSIRPDLTIKTTIANGISGSVMPAWSQAKGGPLTDPEIDDLTAFILSLPAGQASQPGASTAAPAEPYQPSWLAGWGGVVFFFVLFGLIIAGALYIQRRPSP